MRHTHFFSFAIFVIAIVIGVGFVGISSAHALSANDIVFPVSDLGSCKDEKACRVYCDDLSNADACLSFAEKYNLIPQDELKEAKKFAQIGKEGPGGCSGKDKCESYCEEIEHIEECVAFGEKHDLIPQNELKQAKQVAKAIKDGAKLPGGCRGKDACESYCEDIGHIDECLAFAESAGFMEQKELAEARRMAPLMKSGGMPGGCRNKRQCETFCDDDANFEECLAFGEKAGFVSEKEAEMARKTGGKGPGGCKRDECRDYCETPAHQEECFAFGKEHGLIPEEELKNIERHTNELKSVLSDAPPEVAACLKENLGSGAVDGLLNGTVLPGRDIGDKVKTCFEQFGNFGPKGDGSEENDGDEQHEQQNINNGEERGMFKEVENKREQEMKRGFQEHFNLNAVPAPARDCVKTYLESGSVPSDIGGTIERCVRENMQSFDKGKNSENFEHNIKERVFEGVKDSRSREFDGKSALPDDSRDKQYFENPMMQNGDMMQSGGEKFLPQENMMPAQKIDSGMMPPQELQGFVQPMQQTLPPPTEFPVPSGGGGSGSGGGSIIPTTSTLPPQSNAINSPLLGNVLMVVNQLLGH